jgi:hypothetical protein
MAGYSHDSHVADILSNDRAWLAEEGFYEAEQKALQKKAAEVAQPTRRSHPERVGATGGRHAPVLDALYPWGCGWVLKCLEVRL